MNIQNIPKEDVRVKRAFLPKLDAFLFFDYDSIELRLLAFYMEAVGDKTMVEAFKQGKDLHEESAKAILEKSVVTKTERDYGKTFNYATVYGQGITKCALVLGITKNEAKEALGRFRNLWPGIPILQSEIEEQLLQRGYIKTLEGRRLHPTPEYKALNWLIQGSAAGIMREAVRKVYVELKSVGVESHIVNIVHDELMLDCLHDEIGYLVTNVPDLMIDEIVSQTIPMEVSVEYSENTWADKESFSSIFPS